MAPVPTDVILPLGRFTTLVPIGALWTRKGIFCGSWVSGSFGSLCSTGTLKSAGIVGVWLDADLEEGEGAFDLLFGFEAPCPARAVENKVRRIIAIRLKRMMMTRQPVS